jgi:ATP/maltotriose-dependent transcriptional regulator MalT
MFARRVTAATVIGREEELDSIEAFLTEVEQGPAALVLSGEPGIGKTILWETCVDKAAERFGRVLTSHGVEAEATLSFAGLSELLGPVLEEAADSLAAPRRRALEIALLLAEPGEHPPDAHAIGLAVLDVLHALAGRGPLVVALDDVQWLDPSSAAVLQIALRRLREEPIGLLATLRGAREVVPFELERALGEGRLTRLWIGPLTLAALHHLLKERLGLELTRPELARVQETSEANPFFALELGRELERTGTRPTAGQALRVPESLRELLGGRLARLPVEAVDVLLHAAALARPTVELVAAARPRRENVLEALEKAEDEGLILLDDGRVRFAHPLLSSVCYEQAPLSRRRTVHRALAEAVSDIEERARHLALAAEGPDSAIASELDAAGEHAAARGATAAAAELSELAAGLTPADPSLASRRRLRAAHFHRLAGNVERAVAILDELFLEVPAGPERADVLFALAATFRAGSRRPIDLCGQALTEAEGDDARSARILAFRAWNRLLEADVTGSLADARAGLASAERVGDPELVATAIRYVGSAETWAGEITPGILERGAEIEERLGLKLEYLDSPRVSLARWLLHVGELDRARELAEGVYARAAARGDEGSQAHCGWLLGLLEWLAGRWQLALERTTAWWELAEQIQNPHARAWVGRVKALIEIDLGLVESARATVAEIVPVSHEALDDLPRLFALGLLGRLELVLGNYGAAAGYLRDAPGQLLAWGLFDPTLTIWSDAVETLVALGELERARTYLEAYEENAARLGSAWALASAARSRGLVAAAEGSTGAALAAFDDALAQLDGVSFPLERGRTLLCLGSARRQSQKKKAAREALEEALAIFEELGGQLWAEKARSELRRISGRQPTADGLTETEGRVAVAAARGRSNKEIAAELFMAVSTVEMHLSNVYRKLGIRRAGLAQHLSLPAD